MACTTMCAEACGRVLRRRPAEGRGREPFDWEVEGVAMSAKPLERPGEVLLHGHTEGAIRRNYAEQDACAMRPLGAAREEHVEAQLGHVLCKRSLRSAQI